MDEIQKTNIEDCIVKNNKEARMFLIRKLKDAFNFKDEQHLQRYEELWALYDNDFPKFVTETFHKLTKNEFNDFFKILSFTHYKLPGSK